MAINVRIRNGMCPDPTTGEGGATEGDIRGSFSDIIGVVGVKDLAGGHCAVTQNSPAALSVLVAPGIVYIPNADYNELDSNEPKFYEAIIDAEAEVAIGENTSGSTRIDLICVKIDKTITPDKHASNIATLVAVAGTPGAGAPTLPDNYAKLAEVEVANGASTIVNADITNTRVQSKIDFDFLPKATGAVVNTGTEDAKIVTPKAIADSNVSYIDGTETLTNKTLTSPTLQGTVDGWISANETWTYASATTITVPSGAASKYAKGDKIKLTQTTVKYFYIIKVEDTVLTVTGGSDYTVANAAISANYYSHQENPLGFPAFFNFTSTLATDTGTITTETHSVYFKVVGRMVTLLFRITITDKGTGDGGITLTVPITQESYQFAGWGCENTNGTQNFVLAVAFDGNDKLRIKKYDGTTAIANDYKPMGGIIYYYS